MRYLPLLLSLTLALALTACDTADPISADAPGASARADNARGGPAASGQSAVYEARLRPLNPSVNGRGVTGLATFTINGDDFTASVDARNVAVNSPFGIHPLHIHAVDECPTRAADTNGDKIVDVVEGVPFYGGIFLSLDANLTDLSFETTFPSATSVRGPSDYGVINYRESASLSALVSALGEDLALETRTVVLHGIAADTELPESVQTLNSPIGLLPAQLTLPVACGEIRRVR